MNHLEKTRNNLLMGIIVVSGAHWLHRLFVPLMFVLIGLLAMTLLVDYAYRRGGRW